MSNPLGYHYPAGAEHDPRHTRRWCIIGGESGPGARPCDTAWIEALVGQCRATGVAPFVKQLGANSKARGFDNHHADNKGGNMAEWPTDLQVREFP
jgi:protein gp37